MALARIGKGNIRMDIIEPDNKSGSVAIFGPVRGSYLAIFKPKLIKARKADMYSMVIPIAKEDAELLKFVRERINHALIKKFGKVLPKFDSCLQDGDVVIKDDGEPLAPGCMFISSLGDLDQPPLLYAPNNAQLSIANATDWVSGDWLYPKLDFFGYDVDGNKGVSTRIKAVQFAAKDKAFGKGAQDPTKVANEFGMVEGVEETTGAGGFLD